MTEGQQTLLAETIRILAQRDPYINDAYATAHNQRRINAAMKMGKGKPQLLIEYRQLVKEEVTKAVQAIGFPAPGDDALQVAIEGYMPALLPLAERTKPPIALTPQEKAAFNAVLTDKRLIDITHEMNITDKHIAAFHRDERAESLAIAAQFAQAANAAGIPPGKVSLIGLHPGNPDEVLIETLEALNEKEKAALPLLQKNATLAHAIAQHEERTPDALYEQSRSLAKEYEKHFLDLAGRTVIDPLNAVRLLETHEINRAVESDRHAKQLDKDMPLEEPKVGKPPAPMLNINDIVERVNALGGDMTARADTHAALPNRQRLPTGPAKI